jgi:N-acetyl-anhydromuramyl-L-alanine amidase AmpD
MNIIDKFLEKGEYFQQIFNKTTIYLHHTAGGHRADYVIEGWDTDDTVDEKIGTKTARIVATAFVVGGKSSTDGNTAFDGKVYRAFDEQLWAHHLGTTFANNKPLNQASIGIEICNYGPLRLSNSGVFFNYVDKPVPADQVVKLDKPFRGYIYYHAYTDAQLNSVKELIIELRNKYPSIPLVTPLLSVDGFELSVNAKKGVPGIYSHSNVRTDKFDMSPQPKLIQMIKELTTGK